MLDGPAYFGGGATTGNVVVMDNFTTPLSLGTGMTEFGHPPNDGVTSIITSQFSLQWMNGQSWSCPYTAPLLVSPSVGFANALTQFKATQQWAFCWTHTGGPGGYSVYDGGNWTITSSGIITTTAYAGTTTTAGVGGARKGYLITNFTGTRTYTFENGTTQVIALVNVGAPGAAVWGNTINGARFIGSSESGYVANNILSDTEPSSPCPHATPSVVQPLTVCRLCLHVLCCTGMPRTRTSTRTARTWWARRRSTRRRSAREVATATPTS